MKTFNYYIWYIHFLYLCICFTCSSALDTRRSVGFRMLHFLKHHPLVPPAEVQPNSMLNLTLSLWYKGDCKNTIYPFTPFLDLVLVCMILLHQSVRSQLSVIVSVHQELPLQCCICVVLLSRYFSCIFIVRSNCALIMVINTSTKLV